MTKGLDSILAGEQKTQEYERKNLERVYISKDALEKARVYAELSKDHSGSFIECYGYLIGDKDRKHRIAEDVYFAPGQTGTGAHVSIPGSKVTQAGREVNKMGKRILGWWHSHANFHTFHSGTDDENIITVLDQIAPSNYIITYENYDFLADDIRKTLFNQNSLRVSDRNNNSKRLEMFFKELESNPLTDLPLEEVKLRIPMQTSYAYSVVVNAIRGEPYAAIAKRKFCHACRREEDDLLKDVPLRVLDYNSGVEIDEDKMRKEVKEKIYLPSPIVFGKTAKHHKKVYVQNPSSKIFVPAEDKEEVIITGQKPKSLFEKTRKVFKQLTGVDIGQND